MNENDPLPAPSPDVPCPTCGALVNPYAPGAHQVREVTQFGAIREDYIVIRCGR